MATSKKLSEMELIGYKLLIPFKVELEELFENHDIFTFVRNKLGRCDEENSKILIGYSNISQKDYTEVRPIIHIKRGAMQRDRAVIANRGETMDLEDSEYGYGEVVRFNVKFTVTTRNPIECEKISDIIFYYFEWNKGLLRQHGITDSYFDYKSELIPVESGSKIESWQIGVNATCSVYENYFLTPLSLEKSIHEFEILKSLDNYASITKKMVI